MKLLIILLLLTPVVSLIGQTSIQGKVSDSRTGEGIIVASVLLYIDDVLITGTETDFDGNYFFSSIEPSTYNIEVRYVGYSTKLENEIHTTVNEVTHKNIELEESDILICNFYRGGCCNPMIELDNFTRGRTISFRNNRAHNYKTK